ncbi:MAG: MFS transporter, partial [Cyanobacteria bacterium P01_F01_bin.4]
VWLPAQVCSSLNFPLLGSSETALWMEKINPVIQGRVFAANLLVVQGVSAIAILLAGPLADRVFEPAMQSSTAIAHWLAPIFGRGIGAGFSILYVLCALSMLLVGVVGNVLSQLCTLENAEE